MRGARASGALWVLLLVGTPAGAQDGTPPQASPGPALGAAEQVPPTPAAAQNGSPSPGGPTLPAAVPGVDPSVPASPGRLVPPSSVEPARPVAAAAAPAEEPQRSGWFVHADFGAGYLRTTGSRGGSSFSSQGAAISVSLALGWAPSEEWAIALEGLGWKSLTSSGLGQNTSVELQALGLNVTHYFTPADVFATVVVAGTRLAITTDSDDAEIGSSSIGFGFKALLGKEWRIGPNFGLGLAGQLVLSVNREGGQTLRTLAAGLVLSWSVR
jgi:hypothetical protein